MINATAVVYEQQLSDVFSKQQILEAFCVCKKYIYIVTNVKFCEL